MTVIIRGFSSSPEHCGIQAMIKNDVASIKNRLGLTKNKK